MKKRKGYAGLVSGVLGAVVLLAGCGSGQKPAVLTGGSSSASSSASASSPGAATPSGAASSSPTSTTPSIATAVLPADLKIVVDAQTPSDPTQQAIWSGWLAFYQAWYQAIGRSNADDPLYKLWTGQATNGAPSAQTQTRNYIKYFQDSGLTVTGTLRLYQRTIVGSDAQGTHLSWCEDQTNGYTKDVKSGAVNKTQPSRKDFDFYESYEHQGTDGRWITIWIRSIQGDDRCK
jgi:hypothetical protein